LCGITGQVFEGLVAVGDDVVLVNDKGGDGKPLNHLAEALLALLKGGAAFGSFRI